MTVEPLAQIITAFMLAVVVGMAVGVRILRRTPPIKVRIREKQEVLEELTLREEWMDNQIKIHRELVEKAKKYDFRDDAPEIMQMLKRKYKNKDSIRKAKNVVDHIYQMYENRCKKCTK